MRSGCGAMNVWVCSRAELADFVFGRCERRPACGSARRTAAGRGVVRLGRWRTGAPTVSRYSLGAGLGGGRLCGHRHRCVYMTCRRRSRGHPPFGGWCLHLRRQMEVHNCEPCFAHVVMTRSSGLLKLSIGARRYIRAEMSLPHGREHNAPRTGTQNIQF